MTDDTDAQTQGNAERRVYYHWLDGSYVLREWDRDQRTALREAQGLLKLRLLLGDLVTISDMQLVDSLVINEAFSEPGFRSLLEERQDLLRLVAKPVMKPPIPDRRAAIALGGLSRTQRPGWVSTEGERTDRVRKLAELILENGIAKDWRTDGPRQVRNFLLALPSKDPMTARLIGIANGVAHFAHGQSGQSSEPDPQVKELSFFDVLELAREAPRIAPGAEKIVADTIEWVRRNAPDGDTLHQRAFFQNRLANAGFGGRPWPADHEARWQTLVSAWNTAVANTVGARRGGVRQLREGVSISFVLGRPADVLEPALGDTALPSGLAASRSVRARILWDSRWLTWAGVWTVLRDPQVRVAQEAYQAAVQSGSDDVPDKAAQMTKVVGSKIRRTEPVAIAAGASATATFLAASGFIGPQAETLRIALSLPAAYVGGRVATSIAARTLQSAL